MEVWLQVARAVVAGVFLASAVGKLSDLEGVDRAVAALARIPARLARPAALGVIAAECAVAVLTLIPRCCAVGLLAAVVLLALFSVLILRVLRSSGGGSVHCACFGASSARLSPVHVMRNVLLLCCAGSGAVLAIGRGAIWAAGPAGAVALGVGLALAVIVALLDDLVFLFRTEKTT